MPCVSVRVTEQAPRFGKSAPSEKRFWLWPLDLAGPFAVPTLVSVSLCPDHSEARALA